VTGGAEAGERSVIKVVQNNGMMMNRQKVVFFLVVGSAVIFVSVASILIRWLGPPDLEATATEVALRGTKVAIAATESAIKGMVTPPGGALVPKVLSGKQTWNGLEIAVVQVREDGWLLVEAHNKYNKPPLPGKRMLLITVQVRGVNGDEEKPISVGKSDFKVVGEQGKVYNTYSKETGCGVVPDQLDGVVTYDHSIRGAICMQVPEDEVGFVLVYDPSGGDEPAVYIPLPEGE